MITLKILSFLKNVLLRKQNGLSFTTKIINLPLLLIIYLDDDKWDAASVNTFSGFKFYLLIVDDFSLKS